MLSTLLLPLLLGMLQASEEPQMPPQPPLAELISGTFTNEEQVYFEGEAGRSAPTWLGLRIARTDAPDPAGLTVSQFDRFGNIVGEPVALRVTADGVAAGECVQPFMRSTHGYIAHRRVAACEALSLPIAVLADGLMMAGGEGAPVLRRARPFTCWVSVRRHADRANGEADWSFDRALPIHDQGGRVLVSPEGAPPVVIRMRNVVWPAPSTNRPSLVLYVHRPESPDRAESYSWADPDARMVGINLRWMQASCTRV